MRSSQVLGALSCSHFIWAIHAQSTTRPLRCEDSIDGEQAFAFSPDALSCVSSGCMQPNIPNTPNYNPNIAPGAYNATNVPYCAASCLHPGATQQQLALAPSCWQYCNSHDAATPEQQGWCMYWCVDGKQSLVQSTTCEPEIGRVPATTVIGTMTETYLWISYASWYINSPTASGPFEAQTDGIIGDSTTATQTGSSTSAMSSSSTLISSSLVAETNLSTASSSVTTSPAIPASSTSSESATNVYGAPSSSTGTDLPTSASGQTSTTPPTSASIASGVRSWGRGSFEIVMVVLALALGTSC